MKFKVFRSLGRDVARAVKVYKRTWEARITSAISELISMRMMIGRASEGELGLAIAKFVKESFKSAGIVRRVSKLSKTSVGKTYMSYVLLDVIRKVEPEKVKVVIEDIKSIKDKSGLEFFEGIMNIINERFAGDVRKRIDKMFTLRVSNAVVGRDVVYDPVSERLIGRDYLTGKFINKKFKLTKNNVYDLYAYGIKDKDVFVHYAE